VTLNGEGRGAENGVFEQPGKGGKVRGPLDRTPSKGSRIKSSSLAEKKRDGGRAFRGKRERGGKKANRRCSSARGPWGTTRFEKTSGGFLRQRIRKRPVPPKKKSDLFKGKKYSGAVCSGGGTGEESHSLGEGAAGKGKKQEGIWGSSRE